MKTVNNFSKLIRDAKTPSNVLTNAAFQLFCNPHKITIGQYNGKEVYPRLFSKRDKTM